MFLNTVEMEETPGPHYSPLVSQEFSVSEPHRTGHNYTDFADSPHLAKLLLKAGPSRAHASAVVDIAVHSAVQIVLDGFVTCCLVDI